MGNVASILPQPAADEVDIALVLLPHLLDSQRFRPLAVVHRYRHIYVDYLNLSRQVDALLACGIYLGQNFVWREMH